MPIFLACIATTCVLALMGVILGFNSAGQRRNDAQRWSWAGFFTGTAVLSMSLIAFAAFWSLKLPVVTSSPGS